MSALFHNARVIAHHGVLDHGWVRVSGGLIVGLGEGAPPPEAGGEAVLDLGGAILGPGFIDLHIHGAVGHDLMTASPDGFAEVARFLASHGVTAFLAATYSQSPEALRSAALSIARNAGTEFDGARLLGAYLEGPYFSERRRGAHGAAHLRAPDRGEVQALIDTGGILVMSHAPELLGSEWLSSALTEAGIVVAVGHTDATAAEIAVAVDRGATLVTHLFNGMRGIHHREPGTAGAALVNDGLVCELIGDGVHLVPEILDLVWRVKGGDRIALVTDGGPGMGLADTAVGGRVARLTDGTLSSSNMALDHGVRTLSRATGAPLEEIWPSASTVPARVLGMQNSTGSIAVGLAADLVSLDGAGAVQLTVVGGRVVFRGGAFS
ncbi:MAG TPA: N-acetylglucosamine-6-phosphate deacetylase [Lacisediminihabitans sp.]|uniref:N-acetylglucosamine-6-phosphate deacetylase n=1 Tax=Lacisediminihabitans sp. TaxID=2787631 RepID=UPI002EDA5F4E